MLKCKNFISKYTTSLVKDEITARKNILEKIKININKNENFYIYNNMKHQHKKEEVIPMMYFFISDFYSKFYQLKNKIIISNTLELNSSPNQSINKESNFESSITNKFLQNFLQVLLENNLVYMKTKENNSQDPRYYYYYLKLNNLKYLNILEKSIEECRVSKQQYKWSNLILNQQEKLLNKIQEVKIHFEIRDESIKEKQIVFDQLISVTNPELIFGTTFIAFKSNSEIFKKINLDNITGTSGRDNKSFKLPSKIYAINPINNEKIQIILIDPSHQLASEMETEIRMCVPGHNELDNKLAKEFSLPIKFVVQPISQMAKTLSEKTKSSDNIEELIKIKSTPMEEIKKNIKYEISNGAVILNEVEGFLTGCKEFDYLYLKEAKELIIKNLIQKGKAKYDKYYDIKDLLLAEGSHSLGILNFSPIYQSLMHLYAVALSTDKENTSNVINVEYFKKLFPVDLFININDSEKIKQSDFHEILLYSRFIYRIILDILKLDKVSSIWKDSESEDNSEDIIVNNDTIKEYIFSEPIKEIIDISEYRNKEWLTLQSKNITALKEYDDYLRLGFYLSIENQQNFLNIDQLEEILEKFFSNLEGLHEAMIKLIIKGKFDIDKVRDEMINFNKKSNNNLVIELNKIMIDIIHHIENNKAKIGESAMKIINLLDLICDTKSLYEEHHNYLIFLYFNYLFLIYPFCPCLANGLYQDLKRNLGNSKLFPNEFLHEFSLIKLEETCKFFKDMIIKTSSVNVLINGDLKGSVIIDKKFLSNKQAIIEIIKEKFNLNMEIGISGCIDEEIEIDGENIKISLKN